MEMTQPMTEMMLRMTSCWPTYKQPINTVYRQKNLAITNTFRVNSAPKVTTVNFKKWDSFTGGGVRGGWRKHNGTLVVAVTAASINFMADSTVK